MPLLSRHALALAALTAALAGPVLLAQKTGDAPAGEALPKFAKKALDDHFGKKWELASVDPQAIACRSDGGPPPAIVQADFNSDGMQDVAVVVKAEGEVRLVAVLARVDDSTLVNVDTLGHDVAAGYLNVEARGTKYKDPTFGLDDTFTSDTLAIRQCGQPTTIYRWTGEGFNKVAIQNSK